MKLVGRWSNMLIVPKHKSQKDIDFLNADKIIRKSLKIKGQERQEIIILKDGESAYYKCVNSALVKDIKWNLMKKLIDNNPFYTYAVLTPDGEWNEPGLMGWWGISSATPEEENEFNKNYENNFIKTANPEWRLTIVDCHI